MNPPPESFEIFDGHGHLLGQLPRPEVHRLGHWHRSVDVWLFRRDGRLLLQRRARTKDLYADCWDYSVGEHLLPGESFLHGAVRGLAEELGIEGAALCPLGGLRRRCIEDPAQGIHDRELCRSFRAQHDGPVRVDPLEVAEVAWCTSTEVRTLLEQQPRSFTPWFALAAEELAILPP